MTLEGRTALVTGGGSGFGRAMAERFHGLGAEIIVVDKRAEAGDVARSVGGSFIHADLLAEATDVKIGELAGHVDILVNNAGFQHVAPIEDFPYNQWEDMLKLMLTMPFILTQMFLPDMKKQRWGRIINISSQLGKVALPNKTPYTAVKHGLIGLTRGTALEMARYGITCNAICPSFARTPLIEEQIEADAEKRGLSVEETETLWTKQVPLGRLVEPVEVAGLAAFLCSDEAAAITGADYSIDGGYTAQ